MLAVLGNHDYESNAMDGVRGALREGGITVLDGDSCEVLGVGFAGVKGFCGGFGRGTLGPWGEEAVKRFVHEAVQEALKLESALARLRTSVRIVLLHYAPIVATVVGRATRDLPVSRQQPPRRTAGTPRSHRHLPRARASRRTRGTHRSRHTGLQRVAAAPHPALSRTAAEDRRGERRSERGRRPAASAAHHDALAWGAIRRTIVHDSRFGVLTDALPRWLGAFPRPAAHRR